MVAESWQHLGQVQEQVEPFAELDEYEDSRNFARSKAGSCLVSLLERSRQRCSRLDAVQARQCR